MNAITPAKLMPPLHSTAASGTLPTEQTKLSTAITGPISAPQTVCTADGEPVRKRLLKTSLPSWATNPASRKPIVISFHSICQSPRKLWATSDHAAALVSRSRQASSEPAAWCWWPASAVRACSRASDSSRRETNARSSTAISTIITSPPRYSASVNCHPSRIQSTSPSSHTRFVEANWKASAEAAEAPFWNRLLAIATAAYEHDEEAAPRPVATATGRGPSPASARSIRSRGTHACTTAEMKNPNTSAHHTSQAISSASRTPCQNRCSTGVISGGPFAYPHTVSSTPGGYLC